MAKAKAKASKTKKPASAAQAPLAAIDPLFLRVLDNPDDTALRQVWADSLIEKGDPRGELIALQVAAGAHPLTPPQEKARRSLIAKHRNDWLGPLIDIVQHREGLVFDRGVLDACQIQVKSVPALENAIGHPYWSTLRSIWFCDRFAWDARIVPFLTHPVFSRLRAVWSIGLYNVFRRLAKSTTPLPFESIWAVEDRFRFATEADVAELDTLDTATALPNLRRFGISSSYEDGTSERGGRIMRLPVIRRVETLALTVVAPAQYWIEQVAANHLDNIRTLEFRSHWIPIQGAVRSHYRMSLHRAAGKNTKFSRLTLACSNRPRPSMLDTDLDSLSTDLLTEIEIPSATLAHIFKRFHRARIVVKPAPDALSMAL